MTPTNLWFNGQLEYPFLGNSLPSFPFLFYSHRIGNDYGYFLHMVFIANLTSV